MSMMATIMNYAMMLLDESTGFMGAMIMGLRIVGIGFIGWTAIKAAQEGDVWASVTRIVLGGVTLAFVTEEDFRNMIMNIIKELTQKTFQGKF
ncbi:hypothetical protein SAMN05444392_105179 [Seinonella peptonophila]|uniref:Uncharacterized protein n=1 Tax=Seinonella peptonophila TaxID=112248 RepID=A0A1M4XTJ6_9BACL|nr:hypothetical protein [Seinonella peptonophila]SHE96897.1 hypothetical protein SAMN05444392_105179 [Seinonella peptonophila]